MKLYRFIGQDEMKSILTGKKLTNTTDWSERFDTNSKGFCFFQYNRTNNMDKIVDTVLNDWGLGGIVTQDFIVELEVEKARKAWGFYSGGKRSEYNLTEYSLEDVKRIYKVDGKWFDYSTRVIFENK